MSILKQIVWETQRAIFWMFWSINSQTARKIHFLSFSDDLHHNSHISHYVTPSYGRPDQGHLAHCILGKSWRLEQKWESPCNVYICILWKWNRAVQKMIVVIGRILISMNSAINSIMYISVSQHYRQGFMEAFGFHSSKREYNWHLTTTWLRCYQDDIMWHLFRSDADPEVGNLASPG